MIFSYGKKIAELLGGGAGEAPTAPAGMSRRDLEQRVAALEQELLVCRETQERLRGSEERCRTLMEQAPFAVEIYGADGIQLAANRAWEEMWAVDRRDTVGRFNALTDAQARAQGVEEVFRRALAGETVSLPPLKYDPAQAGLGGRQRWSSRTFFRTTDDDGVTQRVVIIQEDLTDCLAAKEVLQNAYDELEEKVKERSAELAEVSTALSREIDGRLRVEAANREVQQQLLTIFNSIDEAIYVSDIDTYEILFANNTLIAQLGPVQGEKCYRAFQDRETPCPFCTNELITGDNLGKTHRWVFRNRRNNRFYRCIDKAIVWPDGRTVRYEMAIDITDRVQAEEDLQRARRMEALGVLAAGIAHDFNNALNLISGYLDRVRSLLPATGPLVECHVGIAESVSRAADLVRQVLTFGRQAKYDKQPIAIASLVGEEIAVQRSNLPPGVEIRSRIDPGCGRIAADAVQIRQVVANLLTNACHAVAAKGSVEVSLEEVEVGKGGGAVADLADGRYLLLTVTDSGLGMTPEVAERIFEPYFSTKGPGQGTGLGLAIVHGIVDGHGGTIAVESAPGQGSSFRVYLPVDDHGKEPPAARADRREKAGAATGTAARLAGRVLLVDDERVNIVNWQMTLQDQGLTVSAHTSAQEALTAFRLNPDGFDLAITDQKMVEMTGCELAAELVRLRPGLPVILVTGWIDPATAEEAKRCGVTRILAKPHSFEEMMDAVRESLAQ